MIWGREIQVPPGFEAVVNGRVDDKRPVRVGRYDQVYRVTFNPVVLPIQTDAPCKEGIPHKVSAKVSVSLERNNLPEILRDAGASTYRNVLNISANEIADREKLKDLLEAGMQACLQTLGFFQLQDHDLVGKALDQVVKTRCHKARVAGSLQAFSVAPAVLDAQAAMALLTGLAARAGAKSDPDGSQMFSDANLGRVVEYLQEVQRQEKLLAIPIDRANAQAETARVQTEKQLATARAEVKIIEAEQEARVKARQDEIDQEEAKRKEAALARNAAIMERTAGYEAEYKRKRAEEEISLNRQRHDEEVRLARQRLEEEFEATKKKVEIATLIDQEELARRERKRLDLALNRDHERELAGIRATENKEKVAAYAQLLSGLASIPATNYSGVHTLISGGGAGSDSRDAAVNLVLTLLSRLGDVLERPERLNAASGQGS
jgi:hypothetical protein